MTQTVTMPKFGQATEESTIIKWCKKEGDAVKKGDILFEIETDKAAMEVESFYEGTLLKIIVGEGQTVPVTAPVAFVGAPGEALPALAPTPAPAPAKAAAQAAPEARPTAPVKVAAGGPATPVAAAPVQAQAAIPARQGISPRARALIAKCAITAANIRGTGPNSRIVEKDVRDYLASVKYDQIRISPAARNLAIKEGVDIVAARGTGESGRIMTRDIERAIAERPRPMTRMRQVIAQRLTQSFTTTPHFYVTVSADMTGLMALRKELKAQGSTYSVTDFILEAVILALQEFPVVNSATDGKTVRWNSSVNLGMAVSREDGLVVPVIRRAEELSMRELHDTAADLAVRARDGKLSPDEMTGGTFTVSNMGMLNVENFSAIINPGEGAILAVAGTRDTPVVVNGQIQVRAMMKMTVSCDHRIIDGTAGAQFINAIKAKLEDVELWKSLT